MRLFCQTLILLVVSSPLALANDKEELGKATKKTSELRSYAFKLNIEMDGAPMPMDPFEFKGKVQQDLTYAEGSIMGRNIVAYRKGGKTVVKNENDEWQLLQGRGRGRGPMGGMMGRDLKPPHQDLKGFEGHFKEVKKAEEKENVGEAECAVYQGELTKNGALATFGGRGLGRMMGQAKVSGKAKLWVGGDGVVRKYEIKVNLAFTFQENEVEMTISRTTELSKLNETKIEAPEEVTKLLDKKEEPKKEEKKSDDNDF